MKSDLTPAGSNRLYDRGSGPRYRTFKRPRAPVTPEELGILATCSFLNRVPIECASVRERLLFATAFELNALEAEKTHDEVGFDRGMSILAKLEVMSEEIACRLDEEVQRLAASGRSAHSIAELSESLVRVYDRVTMIVNPTAEAVLKRYGFKVGVDEPVADHGLARLRRVAGADLSAISFDVFQLLAECAPIENCRNPAYELSDRILLDACDAEYARFMDELEAPDVHADHVVSQDVGGENVGTDEKNLYNAAIHAVENLDERQGLKLLLAIDAFRPISGQRSCVDRETAARVFEQMQAGDLESWLFLSKASPVARPLPEIDAVDPGVVCH